MRKQGSLDEGTEFIRNELIAYTAGRFPVDEIVL